MKLFSKKMLSIFAALCILAGIAIPAGIISAAGETTTVYEIDFAASGTTSSDELNTYTHTWEMSKGSTYTFSFDYYLPYGSFIGIRDFAMNSSATEFVDFANEGRWSVLWLENGVHHYEITFTAPQVNFIPGFFTHAKKGYSNIYVWNWSLVKEGTTANALADKSFGGSVANYVKAVNVDVSKFGTDPIVNEIKFTDGALTWTPALYQGNNKMTAGQEIGVSFDYYVADDTTFSLELVGDSASATKTDAIEKGMGKYEATFQLKNNANGNNGVFCPKFTASAATTLYVWNMKITMGGAEKLGFIHPASYSAAEEVYTLAAGAKFLSEYAWAQPEEENVVYKLDFSNTTSTSNEVAAYPGAGFNGSSNITSAEIEFSYYLSDDAAIILQNAGGRGAFYQEDGSCELKPGLHTYKGTWTKPNGASAGLYPGIFAMQKWGSTDRNIDCQLYIWDMTITANDGAIAANSSFSYDLSQWASGGFAANGGTVSTVSLEEIPTALNNGGMYKLEIDATNGEKDIYRNYLSASAGAEYTFSFDYFVPKGVVAHAVAGGWTSHYDSDSGLVKDATTGESKLVEGKGSFSATVKTKTTNLPFGIRLNAGQSATIYVWNVSMKKNNTGNNLYAGVAWNGTATKTFIPYDEALFVNPDNSPIVTAVDLTDKSWYPSVNAAIDSADVNISFDYYLPNDVDITYTNIGGFGTFTKNDKSIIAKGKGTFSVTLNLTKNTNNTLQHAFALEQAATKIYIWNYKAVTANGTELTADKGGDVHYAGKGDYVDGENGNKLSTFAWKDAPDNGAKLEIGGGNNEDIPGDPNDPIVTEIDFTKGDTWAYEVLRNANVTPDNPFKITFEYFLPEKASLQFDSVGGWLTMAGGSKIFNVGHHTFEVMVATDMEGSKYPSPIVAPKIVNEAMDAKLYIWNISVTVDGVEQVPNNPGEVADKITAGVTKNKRLSQYDWYPTMDEVAGNYEDTVAKRVYALRFDKFNWELADYSINAIVFGRVRGIYKGMNLNLSFDYYVEGEARTHVFNPYVIWKDFELHPGADFGGYLEDLNKVSHASYDFVTNENDAKHEGGTIGIGLQQQIDYGQAIVYIWNLKLTQDGSNMNMLTDDFDWSENHMQRNKLIQLLDIDPSTIGPGMKHPEFNNPDYVVEDLDTDDVVIEDDQDESETDTGNVDFGSDFDTTHIYNAVEDQFEYVRDDTVTGIVVGYNGDEALVPGAHLSIYKYQDNELTADTLALLGDKKFTAYEVLMALDEEYLNLTGDIVVCIPITAGFDASAVKAYGIDEYGDLFAVDMQLDEETGYVYIFTDVLGSFILVDGEAAPAGDSTDGDSDSVDGDNDSSESTDDDKPADTKPSKKPSKNNKKNNAFNGWVLWVIIGGVVVLLAAGGVVAFLVIKKKKAAK